MTTNLDPIVTNQQFRARWVLRGLEHEDEQFRISPSATVEAIIKSPRGNTAYTPWVTLNHDDNRDDNWSLSTIDLIFDSAHTALVVNTDTAIIAVRIQGVFVDRDGTDTTDTYDKIFSALYPVEEGLA